MCVYVQQVMYIERDRTFPNIHCKSPKVSIDTPTVSRIREEIIESFYAHFVCSHKGTGCVKQWCAFPIILFDSILTKALVCVCLCMHARCVCVFLWGGECGLRMQYG